MEVAKVVKAGVVAQAGGAATVGGRGGGGGVWDSRPVWAALGCWRYGVFRLALPKKTDAWLQQRQRPYERSDVDTTSVIQVAPLPLPTAPRYVTSALTERFPSAWLGVLICIGGFPAHTPDLLPALRW